MNESSPLPPRRRLQELLAIPDSQRTDAEWDEIVELEISLAPGNRIGQKTPENPVNRSDRPKRHKPPAQPTGQPASNPGRNRRHRPPKKKTP